MAYKKIPDDLRLGGQDIKVEIIDHCDNYVCGNCCLAVGVLRIGDKVTGGEQSESSKINTFYHELTHLVLDTMGRSDLSSDEAFVCSFSGFLTEAMSKAEFRVDSAEDTGK